MLLAYLTLITGLAISAVAIYYSVIGLAAIFSAAVIPIIIMGAILEVSKLVSAWWLKANWERAPFLLKSYMLVAVIVLMLITSMGIFGFLSKAHTDQAIVTGDVSAQVYLIDEQIKVERENIANAQSLIKQLDDAVVGINASGVDRELKLRDGSTRVQSAAERALQVRRSQSEDRAKLTKQVEESQKKILELQQKKAPIASQMREVEAKVGPIKYIAQLIYGNDPDENLLEKAVTWVIITIVFVFDPLAVLLLLASQMSFQWARPNSEERKNELVQENTASEGIGEEATDSNEPEVGTVVETVGGESESGSGSGKHIPEVERVEISDQTSIEIKETLDDAKSKLNVFLTRLNLAENKFPNNFELFEPPKAEQSFIANIEDSKLKIENKETIDGLEAWNKMIEEAEKAIDEEKSLANVVWTDALQQWREKNSEADIYEIQRSYDAGEIEELPWDTEYKKYKILPELKDHSTYVQNEEQNESNLWQEARKNVEISDKESLSQEDYQIKVHKAIIRDLIKNINDGTISVTDLTEEEIKNVEDYLKENDDGKNNTDQST